MNSSIIFSFLLNVHTEYYIVCEPCHEAHHEANKQLFVSDLDSYPEQYGQYGLRLI